MKNIKSIFASFIVVMGLLSSQLSVAMTSKKQQDLGPGFEFFNKSRVLTTIVLFVNGQFKETANIVSQGRYPMAVDLNQPIQLGIYGNVTNISMTKGTLLKDITPLPYAVYEFNAPGKTKYISWDPEVNTMIGERPLHPQTGPLLGLLGKSASGFPLGATNISSKEIRGLSKKDYKK
jgi:hypothetical protein